MLIYIITNDVNDKVYIGQTTKTLEERIQGHRNSMVTGVTTHIYNAMRKYGWDKFHFRQIATADSQEDLDYLEQYYIAKYDSVRNGYNMALGGSTNTMDSPIVRAKHDAKMRSPEIRKQISESMKASYAKRGGPTREHRNHLSESRKALYASERGEEVRQKFRESFRLSPEHFKALNDAKNKAVYCVDISGSKVAEFQRVKDAAQWWYDQGYKVKDVTQLSDKIRESYKQDRYIKGLKWIYRV